MTFSHTLFPFGAAASVTLIVIAKNRSSGVVSV